jgi:hypothetical protein
VSNILSNDVKQLDDIPTRGKTKNTRNFYYWNALMLKEGLAGSRLEGLCFLGCKNKNG